MAEAEATGIGADEIQTDPRYLFRQPLALQWFDAGKLVKRYECERQAGRFELFLDLLYVAIVANFAEDLASHVTGAQLVKYILILAPSWHVWSDLRELMNSFYNDDLLQRVFILWVMAILVVYGNNAPLVDQDIAAMRATVGAYLTARVSTNSMHLYYSFASYHHRAQQRLWFVLATFALCLYIPLFVENLSFRAKIGFTAAAIGTEELVWVFCYSPIAKRLLQARYTTAVDVPHEVDRIGAFYILVLGEFLYQIVVSSPAAIGFNVDLMRAIWTLIIAFCLNWMYVHNDGSLQGLHPLKYDIIASFLWITLHLPLVASLLAGGHVASTSAKGDDFDDAHRWLLCASLGTGMICLYGIALLHKTQDPPCFLILDKPYRIIMRFIVGIIMILLPLAHHISLTDVLSIIMSLTVFCLIWENITALRRDACIWETWKDTDPPERNLGICAVIVESLDNEQQRESSGDLADIR